MIYKIHLYSRREYLIYANLDIDKWNNKTSICSELNNYDWKSLHIKTECCNKLDSTNYDITNLLL